MKARRVITAFVAAFVVIGGVLPSLLPAYDGHSGPTHSKLQPICNALYFIQNMLPTGTSDTIRIPVGIVSLALWGLASALLFLLLRRLAMSLRSTKRGM